MRCPACSVAINLETQEAGPWQSEDYNETGEGYELSFGHCPDCGHLIVLLRTGGYSLRSDLRSVLREPISIETIYPVETSRPIPEEVPAKLRDDYQEAVAVLNLSPKASAALSRRILQTVLQEHFEIKHRDLAAQIEDFVSRKNVPSYLGDAVDAIRHLGNLAAHPTKNKHTGEIVDVEPGEAEWLLEVLEGLFDFAFVQPRKLAEKRATLNAKLAAIGKPELKSSPTRTDT